jgi:activator of HSP90 ATPase
MAIEFEISELIPAAPEVIYAAWLDSDGHSQMTGSPAQASAEVGGSFSAWDGYISGQNLALEPGRRILQAWRTSEFADTDADSRLEVLLEAAEGGTQVTLRHTNLPDNGEQYRQGWTDFYFTPMKAYFVG